MKTIKIFDQIGYLRRGGYQWVYVIGVTETEFSMLSLEKVGRNYVENRFKQNIQDVLKWLKTPSPDYPGKMLLKHKGFKGLHTPDALIGRV